MWLFCLKEQENSCISLGPTRSQKDVCHQRYTTEKWKSYPLPQQAYIWGGKTTARQSDTHLRKQEPENAGHHSQEAWGKQQVTPTTGIHAEHMERRMHPGQEPGRSKTRCGCLVEQAEPLKVSLKAMGSLHAIHPHMSSFFNASFNPIRHRTSTHTHTHD